MAIDRLYYYAAGILCASYLCVSHIELKYPNEGFHPFSSMGNIWKLQKKQKAEAEAEKQRYKKQNKKQSKQTHATADKDGSRVRWASHDDGNDFDLPRPACHDRPDRRTARDPRRREAAYRDAARAEQAERRAGRSDRRRRCASPSPDYRYGEITTRYLTDEPVRPVQRWR